MFVQLNYEVAYSHLTSIRDSLGKKLHNDENSSDLMQTRGLIRHTINSSIRRVTKWRVNRSSCQCNPNPGTKLFGVNQHDRIMANFTDPLISPGSRRVSVASLVTFLRKMSFLFFFLKIFCILHKPVEKLLLICQILPIVRSDLRFPCKRNFRV